MIDLSNLKAPGWGRVVAELSAGAPDDRAFLERLMAVLAQVSAARQAVLFAPDRREGDEPEARLVTVWPREGADGGAATPHVEQEAAAKKAARVALSTGQPQAFGLDKDDPYYGSGAGGQGYILAVPLGASQGATGGAAVPATGAISLLIEPRSKDAVRSTLAMAEVLAGYVYGHGARQALKRSQQAGAALDLATRLIASINSAPGFKGAMLQLGNDLAKHFAVDRVAIGWVRGGRGAESESIRVEAISDTEHFDRRMAMVQRLKAAMDECLDQAQPVLFPQPPADGPKGDVMLAQAIVHAHRELVAGDAKLRVASLPLRLDETVVGVVSIESAGQGEIDLATIELVQSAMDLVTPVLAIRRSDDRNLAQRAWHSSIKAGAWAVGPRNTAWKVAGLLLLATMLFISLYKTTYRIGAEAVLEPATRRIVSAPIEGVVESIADGLVPGKMVNKGDVLVELDDQEWRLRMIDAQARVDQARLQASAARNEHDAGKEEQYNAQADRAESERRVYEYQINRARITAPITGVVLSGRLEDKIGGAVKLGDALLEIAPLDDIIVIARVDERDVSLVKDALLDGRGSGAIATKSRPNRKFNFVTERVVPLAEAKEGKNTFEVRAKLTETAAWMQPGMEGLAKFDTERHSLLWIGSRRIVDTIRMWLW
ncbi:MAG: HlyD family efflux transporter periplasmic adaptor subunit [Phycisphaerales bacterium]|nr:HlyD family efflux transporter periplasmic adaptor subunit [Phycisphaerales bacterium]